MSVDAKCPFSSDTNKPFRARSNNDWWPDAPNLSILHCNSP